MSGAHAYASQAIAAFLKVKRTERRLAIAEYNLNYWVSRLSEDDMEEYFTATEKIEADFAVKIERAEGRGY